MSEPPVDVELEAELSVDPDDLTPLPEDEPRNDATLEELKAPEEDASVEEPPLEVACSSENELSDDARLVAVDAPKEEDNTTVDELSLEVRDASVDAEPLEAVLAPGIGAL